VSQRGYCQPGQIMTAVATVPKALAAGRAVSQADLDRIRDVCRCGTYSPGARSIEAGAAAMAADNRAHTSVRRRSASGIKPTKRKVTAHKV
jgi:aerobic-type carbon monoxide dehydrogenase small subunit (CoxS/CutS family)